MLVLSRKNQESVVVGGSCDGECLLVVKVLEIRGNRVKLGFEATGDLLIRRSEMWEPAAATSQTHSLPGKRKSAEKQAKEQWDDDGGAVATDPDCLVAYAAVVSSHH